MLGSIIGDIAGSIYEFDNIKTKEFSFLGEGNNYTDDSILTCATADWILSGGDPSVFYAEYAMKYPCPMGGYGSSFSRWAIRAGREGIFEPYNSCGNGSAMRVSPVGWACNTEEEVLDMAKKSAESTHNHPEGIKGAQATALCIFMARHGHSKEEIRSAVSDKFNYDLSFTVDEIRDDYGWHSERFGNGILCQASVPQAIVAFLDGKDFEDSVRNAISLGGDSDTIGCITGAIAEAYFGIPKDIYAKGMSYLDQDFRNLVKRFEEKYGNKVV